MSRRHALTEQLFKECFFYAPLTSDNLPTIAWDGNLTVYRAVGCTIEDDALHVDGGTNGIIWDCAVPQGRNLTFSCWVKKSGSNGVSYNFGCGPKQTTTRYTGLNYSEYNYYLLMQEYMYFYLNPNRQYLTQANQYVFISWTIIFSSNDTYTIKIYKNGVLDNHNTVSYSGFQKFAACYFEISHFTNTMNAFNRHFSCYDELTDEEVFQLYNNGGLPL